MSIGGGYDTNEFVARFYDHIPGYRDRSDVDFYVGEAKSSNGPILELCCGTGRLVVPIAREHIQITGVDLSPHMLERCRHKLEDEADEVTASVRLVQADMRNFKLDEEFGLAIVAFRSFQHLTAVSDQCACLSTVNQHLKHGGRIILDLFNPNLETLVADNVGVELAPDGEFTIPDGTTVMRTNKFVSKNLAEQVNDMEMTYRATSPDGTIETFVHAFPMRYLFRYEAEHLLSRCGFDLVAVYSDFNRTAFGSDHPGELVLVAEKA